MSMTNAKNSLKICLFGQTIKQPLSNFRKYLKNTIIPNKFVQSINIANTLNLMNKNLQKQAPEVFCKKRCS